MQSEELQDGVAIIRFLNGPLADTSISIQNATTSFGRGTQNDVVVLDPSVSRQLVIGLFLKRKDARR
jgi:hypothetical protein